MSGKMTGFLMGGKKAGSCSSHLEDGDLPQKVTTGRNVERSARFPLACWVSRQGRPGVCQQSRACGGMCPSRGDRQGPVERQGLERGVGVRLAGAVRGRAAAGAPTGAPWLPADPESLPHVLPSLKLCPAPCFPA